MSTLYELTGEYMMLLSMAEDPDVDPEVFEDTLEAMDGEIEEKADGYGKVIKELEHRVGALDDEIKRMQALKITCTNNIDRMKRNLKESMIMTGKTKFKTSLFSFGIRSNRPSVIIDDESALPIECTRIRAPEPDKKQIYERLKNGEEVPGAHLEQSTSVRIS